MSVFLWTHDSHKLNLKGKNTRQNKNLIKRRPTSIGKNCFLAGPSLVMPGVKIGNNCIIGPMSLVYKDLPNNSIYTPYRDMLNYSNEIFRLKEEIKDINIKLNKLISKK